MKIKRQRPPKQQLPMMSRKIYQATKLSMLETYQICILLRNVQRIFIATYFRMTIYITLQKTQYNSF